MTVATEVRSVEYAGDGVVNDFPVTFEVLDASHIRVTYYPASGSPVVLTQGTNPGYTVNSPPDSIKNVFPVTASVPLEVGASIIIERVVPITQAVDLTNQGTYDAETHEEAWDLGVMVDQQLNDRLKALESAGAAGSVVAGNGLSFSGTTLNVGANADGSIVVAADDVRVGVLATDAQHGNRAGGALHANAISGGAAGFQSGTDKQRADALWARTITAGAGLTGGGDLSANRTLDVVANADGSIVVNANDVQVGVLATDAQHGARGGGTQHAVATTATAGFMSAADKTKLDGLATETITTGTLTTSDATDTTIVSITPTDGTAEILEITIIGKQVSSDLSWGYRLIATVDRFLGTTVQTGSTTTVAAHEDNVAADANVAIASPAVNIRVKGIAATTINWRASVRRLIVS